MFREVRNATLTSAAAVLSLLISVPVSAKSLGAPATSWDETVAQARRLVMSRPSLDLGQRTTLQAKSMGELALRTANIAKDAFQRYGGDAARYSAVSNMRNQRAGKTLEAVIAWRVNAQRAKLGVSERMLVTAVEGYPHDPADLVDIGPNGSTLKEYQVKWGWKSTVKAIRNPKYRNMMILTTRDSWREIARESSAAEARAARRGISLSPQWQAVREAIESDRLPRIVGGKQLPRADAVQRFGESLVQRFFRQQATRSTTRNAPTLSQHMPSFAGSGRLLGNVFVVADVAGTGYAEFQDIQRFRAGAIGGGYLTFKSGLRILQLDLAYYAAVSPEPSTKVLAAIAAGALIVVDIASDPVYAAIFEKRQAAARALLQSVESEERYHAVRFSLVHEI